MANWRDEINEAMAYFADGPLIACTLTDAEAAREFDGGYGGVEGTPFTAWTERRVYFPVCHSGLEWVGSVPRNPCDEALGHRGGG